MKKAGEATELRVRVEAQRSLITRLLAQLVGMQGELAAIERDAEMRMLWRQRLEEWLTVEYEQISLDKPHIERAAAHQMELAQDADMISFLSDQLAIEMFDAEMVSQELGEFVADEMNTEVDAEIAAAPQDATPAGDEPGDDAGEGESSAAKGSDSSSSDGSSDGASDGAGEGSGSGDGAGAGGGNGE